MLFSTSMLANGALGSPLSSMQIRRRTDRQELIPLVRGLYESQKETPGYLLAGAICSPSYLSFEYALRRHGMIPEAVHSYTCASFSKNKTLTYRNAFGTYVYRDVPPKVFPIGVCLLWEQDRPYAMATPEKALCDLVYGVSPVGSMKAMNSLLTEDFRIDEGELLRLDLTQIHLIAEFYPSTNVRLLARTMTRMLAS